MAARVSEGKIRSFIYMIHFFKKLELILGITMLLLKTKPNTRQRSLAYIQISMPCIEGAPARVSRR